MNCTLPPRIQEQVAGAAPLDAASGLSTIKTPAENHEFETPHAPGAVSDLDPWSGSFCGTRSPRL